MGILRRHPSDSHRFVRRTSSGEATEDSRRLDQLDVRMDIPFGIGADRGEPHEVGAF